MKKNIFRKILTTLVIIIGLINIFNFIYMLGGGFAYNDSYAALQEFKDLDSKNLLHNPPEHISSVTRQAWEYLNSSGIEPSPTSLQNYMDSIDADIHAAHNRLPILASLFFAALLLRLGFSFHRMRKKMSRTN